MAKRAGGMGRRLAPRRPKTLAEKLDFLFRQAHGRGKGELSYRQVAGGIARAGGPRISPTYLMYLRKGERVNPSMQHVAAIAAFFGVPATYFLDDKVTKQMAEEVELIAVLRDAGVRTVALQMAELSAEGLAVVTKVVEQVRRAERQAAKARCGARRLPRPEVTAGLRARRSERRPGGSRSPTSR